MAEMSYKICSNCGILKSLDDYYKHNNTKDKRQIWCKGCMKNATTEDRRRFYNTRRKERRSIPEYRDREYKLATIKRHSDRNLALYKIIKRRAKIENIPFSLELEDIKIPSRCPVLGYPFSMTKVSRSMKEPSVDKIIPDLGYVKGNIMIISRKANTMKNDATLEELELFCKFYLNLIKYWKK